MNKYERTPEYIIDLHRQTKEEARLSLDSLLKERKFSHIRVITGKGSFRPDGPVLREFVRSHLTSLGCRVEFAKLQNGGEGALEVYLTYS